MAATRTLNGPIGLVGAGYIGHLFTQQFALAEPGRIDDPRWPVAMIAAIVPAAGANGGFARESERTGLTPHSSRSSSSSSARSSGPRSTDASIRAS